MYAYLDSGFGLVWQMPGHADSFHSNHVVLNADGEYGAGGNMCVSQAAPTRSPSRTDKRD